MTWRRAQSQWRYFWMCPKQMCHTVAGSCEGLTEKRPCGLNAMECFIVFYVSFSRDSDYIYVITRAIFQTAVLGGDASVILSSRDKFF